MTWSRPLIVVLLLGACSVVTDAYEYGEIEVVALRRSGEPVPGVALTLYTGTRHLGYGTTGPDGRFTFDFVPAGLLGVLAEPPEGYRPVDLAGGYIASQPIHEGDRASVEFTYLKFGEGSVVVRVEEENGAPISGIRVQLYNPAGAVDEGVTGSAGEHTFSGIPLGMYGVFAFPERGFSFAEGPIGIADALLIDEGHLEDVRFRLAACRGVLRIRALDSSGGPVKDLPLQIYTATGVEAEGRTGEDGTLEYLDLLCGEFGIFVAPAPGLIPTGAAADGVVDGILIGEGDVRTVNLTFNRCSGGLRARVRDVSGTSVSGARVVLYSSLGFVDDQVTDQAGVASFVAVPCFGAYGLLVEPPNGYDITAGQGSSYFDGLRVTSGSIAEVSFTLRRQ